MNGLVAVPRLIGQTSSAAEARLHRLGLEARRILVAAPGTAPGIVTGQSIRAGHRMRPHSTVTLLVAEAPEWRVVTSFQGSGGGHSVSFRIRGTQWRLVSTMSYAGTCDFVFFCNGPSAQVLGPSTDSSFDLSEGTAQTREFKSGPGLYQISVTPGWDSARWSVEVEDWF